MAELFAAILALAPHADTALIPETTRCDPSFLSCSGGADVSKAKEAHVAVLTAMSSKTETVLCTDGRPQAKATLPDTTCRLGLVL